jgi:oligoribonuclease NrnB/cAMP/cGMP phosphodiesterase (DHH superfamily)
MRNAVINLKLRLVTSFGLTKNVVLTHTDVDGVTCGAVAKRFLGDADVIFAWPRSVASRLRNVRGSGGRLLITDLSLNDNLVNQAAREVARLKASGWEVIWIDHHSWSQEAREAIALNCHQFVVEEAPSASRLVFGTLMPEDAVSEKLAMLGDDADTATNALPLTLAYKKALRYVGRHHLLDAFSRGIFSDNEIDEVSNSLRDDDLRISRYVNSLVPQKTRNGRLFVVLDVLGQTFSGTHAGKVAAEKYGLDFTVMLDSRGMISLFAGVNREINLLPVALKHGGGGHTYACGCTPKISWYSKLRRRMSENYMPPEVKAVLQDIVETL